MECGYSATLFGKKNKLLNMKSIRLIPRLDIKGNNLIKGIHLEGLRVIGLAKDYALDYYLKGADELIYMDSVATLHGRNHLEELINITAENIFIPITVGGGIRSVEDVSRILRSGADKVAINTALVKNPELISEISKQFGIQCLVLSVEAKKVSLNKWGVYINNGRDSAGLDVIEWIKYAEKMGIGEVLLTSIDREGTRKGFDIELIKAVTSKVDVPVIASGGMGHPEHLLEALLEGGADAIAMADILHYKRAEIKDLRMIAKNGGFELRSFDCD